MRLEPPFRAATKPDARRYAREDIVFSYRNGVVAERDGEVVGMLLAFEEPAHNARGEAEEERAASTP